MMRSWRWFRRKRRFEAEDPHVFEREDIEAEFRKIRAERHDFLAHAGALHYMLEEARYDEAKAYLDKLLGEYERTNSAMRGEKAHIAAILLRAMSRAEAEGVKLTLELAQPLSSLPLAPTDQSKLVANVVNNALDAAAAVAAEEDRFVKVTSLIGGGLYVLEVDNGTEPLSRELADRLFRSYGHTTKGGAHRGVGTYIIASIVDSHNGHLEYSAVKNRFSLKLKLPIIR